MRYLRQNTATRITVGPFIAVANGTTPLTAITATSEHLNLVVDDAGVPTLVIDTTATASGGNNDLVFITGSNAGYCDLELTAAQTNYVGRAMLSINFVTDHLPVFHEFMIMPANVYDSLFGTDLLDVSTVQWLGTACATPTVAGVPEVDVTHVAGATTDVSALATNVAAILVDTGTTLQAELDGIQADTEDIQTRLPAALVGGRIDATVDGTGMESGAIAAILTTQATQAYRANGAAPTLAQFMCETLAHLGEAGISGTTKTINQFDGTTPAMTFTLDDATTPTAISRTT